MRTLSFTDVVKSVFRGAHSGRAAGLRERTRIGHRGETVVN